MPTPCPKCQSRVGVVRTEPGGHRLCRNCGHEFNVRLTGRERIVRILEDGWTIFFDNDMGFAKAVIRIDDREDEEVAAEDLHNMVHERILSYENGIVKEYKGNKSWDRKVVTFTLVRGPEAEVTLRFQSRAEREYFLTQLCDGWGEDRVEMKWEGDFSEAKSFDIINTCPYRGEERGETY